VDSLPWQLSEFRLLKLKKGSKIPVEKWGPQGKTYGYKDPELLAWLSQGGNYGVMAGPEHVIIACDYSVIEKVVEGRLPPTFTVRSPRHKTKHFYYRIDKPLTRTILCIPGPEGDPIADIRHGNSFVVGPGSFLEGFGFYEVVDDLPLATITEEELIRALEGFIRTKPIEQEFEPVEGRGITFPITKLLEALGINNLDQVGNELVGPHPVHGSTTGTNFKVNPTKNTWFCFRAGHESGGGPLELLAVMMGLVKCEDCKKPSPLKTDKELFKKVLAEAKKLELVEEDEEEPEKISQKTPPPPGGYISQREEDKEERKSQADRLVEIGLAAELFVDDEGEPYAAFTIDNHREVWPIRSKAFKQWLSLQYFKENGKAPNTDALNQALLTLEGKAFFEGGRRKLWLRVGIGEDGALYYDLGDPQWRAVKITPGGWEVVNDCPIYFKRYQNMDAQVDPEPGGSLSMLFEIAQLSSVSDPSDNGVGDDNTTILSCALPALLIPEIPKPIINTVGEKGSGKTIFYKLIRQLLDPAREPLLSLRRDERELAIQLHHNYLPAFDNVGAIGTLTSDMLCRAATGAGFSTRALYTDEEERIFRIKRGILINGIHPLDGQTDLQDRLLLIELKRIPKEKRKKEEEILAEFEKVRGKLFGAVLTALAEGMACYSRVRLDELPRMADFAVWCAAIAEGVGIGAETFMSALWRNLGRINEKVLETHPLAMAINSLLPEEGRIECTPTELLERLEEEAEKLKLNLKSELWPKSTIALGRRLRELISNLEEAGIKVEFRREGDKGRRIISLQKSKAKSVSSVSLSADDKNLHGQLKADTDRLPDRSQTNLSVDLSVEIDGKNPSKSAQLTTDRSDKSFLTLSAESCSNCQDFMSEYGICSLDGQSKAPGFSCPHFKPKPKKYRCKCGCGPWKERYLAREHLELCKDEPGHEIEEVFD